MHYVLESVFSEIREGEGFKNTKEDSYIALTAKYIEKYIHETLMDFEGKNARFKYLFMRYKEDVVYVVQDMIKELSNSDFEPLDLELDMSTLSDTERGFIDRVDGFQRDGKLYLRVIDYKTRKKAYSFEMTDVLYGRDMQMLIYLFALEKYGSTRYGAQIEPAGVLYVPARDVILNAPRNATEEDLQRLRIGEMRRSGLILDDPTIIEAMEGGEVKNYLPVKTAKDGTITGDGLVNANRVELLSNHVSSMLEKAKREIQNGNANITPYYKNDRDNACTYCQYHAICGFDEELGDKRRFISKKKPEEVWETLEKSADHEM